MQAGSLVDSQSLALSACIYHSLLGHIPEFDRGIKRARFAVLRQTKVPAVLIEGGFLTERGESQLIAKKDWRMKLAQAISVGIENYQALAVKNQPPMLVADYRRQGSGKTVASEESPPPLPPPWQRPQILHPTSLESAVIVP
jgi:N-acetylmuramoyl-L-alanine amidase